MSRKTIAVPKEMSINEQCWRSVVLKFNIPSLEKCNEVKVWLSKALIAVDCSAHVMVIAYYTKFVVLKKFNDSWDFAYEKNLSSTISAIRILSSSYDVSHGAFATSEKLTSFFDRIFLLVGLQDGTMSAFSVYGSSCLFSLTISFSAIKSVELCDKHVTVLCSDCFITLDRCRLMALATAALLKTETDSSWKPDFDSILYEKWCIPEMESVKSLVCLCSVRTNPWKSCLASGNPLPNYTFMAVGKDPLVTIYNSAGKVGQHYYNLYSAVSIALNTLYLTFSKKSQSNFWNDVLLRKLPSEIQAELSLPVVSNSGERISVGPGNCGLAVVYDSGRRIILLDVRNHLVLHVWSGYPDAQFGWLPLHDEASNCSHFILLFVIFVPMKGKLEFWQLQNCRLIATMPVDPQGILISASHTVASTDQLPLCFLNMSGKYFFPYLQPDMCCKEKCC
ncbi:Rab3 GTPase-activating protein regulatory subunit [Trichinella pseudospiralis]|uniref:Rab3 GTPase-activating protein regulatory subunit n=2 Tax=Trichinella pseudospiralis TaxID=6337 RepID=A0A0V1E8I1_TRIPS|nr:Rab3 GTPase-activating protein regulatory subunit [Trichinella pseudospiralis]KRZ39988.1 Rab3 GTPase-activating protein regulatory subunit [Trichinella pseudospiralis]